MHTYWSQGWQAKNKMVTTRLIVFKKNCHRMSKNRIQLTLFVDKIQSGEIEKIRREYNPEQYNLIKSHVTLCREDELSETGIVIHNLKNLTSNCITIDFGSVFRFSENKGVLIPGTGKNKQFHELRKIVLKGVISQPRLQKPHITLIHPRNSNCTNLIYEQIKKVNLPDKLTFCRISLIEQIDGNKWDVLEEFNLPVIPGLQKK